MIFEINGFDVGFDIHPAEDATLEDPGCEEEIEIYEVLHEGIDIQEYICKDVQATWVEVILERLEAWND